MKKIIVWTLLMVTLCNVLALPALAASSWVTGNFGGGYTTVYLSSTNKDGYIKIHTYNCVKGNHTGKCFTGAETSGKILVTLRDTRGNYITSFYTTGGTKLRLGNDHSAYRVYISVAQNMSSAKNFENLGKCAHWGIETVSNTRF